MPGASWELARCETNASFAMFSLNSRSCPASRTLNVYSRVSRFASNPMYCTMISLLIWSLSRLEHHRAGHWGALVAPAAVAARSRTGIDAATLRTTSSGAGFLRTRFIHLQCAALYIEPIHLPDGPRRVVA